MEACENIRGIMTPAVDMIFSLCDVPQQLLNRFIENTLLEDLRRFRGVLLAEGRKRRGGKEGEGK